MTLDSAQYQRSAAPRGSGPMTQVMGRKWMVAAGHPLAAQAAARVLAAGGNAIDAGVAAGFMLGVVHPDMVSFAGVAPILVHLASTGETYEVSGVGPYPRRASAEYFRTKHGGDIPIGLLRTVVPSAPDSWCVALERWGTLSFADTVAGALECAEHGFPTSAFSASIMASNAERYKRFPTSAAIFLPGGKPHAAGQLFVQSELAATIKEMVTAEVRARSRGRAGAIRAARDAFYKGDIARRIADANRAEGGVFTYDDLASFHGSIEKPATTTFHGFEINKAGSWNQGPVLLETLNILEGTDLKAMGPNSADYIHTVHEAIKLAYDDRNAYLGDPAFASVPLKGLLSKPYAAERRKQIGPKAFLEHRPGDPYPFDPDVKPPAARYYPHSQGVKGSNTSGDTTCVDTVDKDGNLFSATPSSGWLLGGAFIAGDTGVPLSNRMQVFDLDPVSPNVLVGGKRPRTTLTPTILLKDGKPFLAISTPGGDSQDQQILNVLLNMMVFDMDVQAAIEAPRINSDHPHSSFDSHESVPGELEIESRVTAKVMDDLRARGHVLRVLGPYAMSTGVVAVGINPKTGTLRGGADPRRERFVFGW